MISVGKQLVALVSLPLAAAIGIPAASYAAEFAAPIVAAPDLPAEPILIDPAAELSALFADTAVTWNDDAPTRVDTALADDARADPELDCMAKVVLHEAGNQPRRGQLAVAEIIINRIESGRFAATACGVANQPGQFFRLASFRPDRDSAAWRNALEIAREARDGRGDAVVPGALFFHAAYASASSFFRSRQRVTTLGDHIFYR